MLVEPGGAAQKARITSLVPAAAPCSCPPHGPCVIAKARALPCDAVILDREDAVAPEKEAACEAAAAAAVREGGFGWREVVIRADVLDIPVLG